MKKTLDNKEVQGCPGSASRSLKRNPKSRIEDNHNCQCQCSEDKVMDREGFSKDNTVVESELTQWPVQIKLMPIKSKFYENANLLIAADCSAYAYGNFHKDFMKNKVAIIGCPKLDDIDYTEKLTEIIKNNDIKSVTIVRMEVPCCGGLERAGKMALQASGKFIPWNIVTISTDGRIIE